MTPRKPVTPPAPKKAVVKTAAKKAPVRKAAVGTTKTSTASKVKNVVEETVHVVHSTVDNTVHAVHEKINEIPEIAEQHKDDIQNARNFISSRDLDNPKTYRPIWNTIVTIWKRIFG